MKQLFFLCIIFSLCLGLEIGVRDFRFLHAVPSGGPVDVWVNGVKTFSNLAFTALSNYTQNTDDCPSLSVMVVPAGAAANASLANKFVSTPKSSSWTLVWRLNAFNQPILDVVQVTECCLSSRRGSASLQFFNIDASGIFSTVDVTYQGGWIWNQLPANKISPFTELRAGNYSFKFTGPGGSLSLSATLLPKVNYGLVLFGGPTFPPLLSLTVLQGCALPNTTFALPPPPPPAAFAVTLIQAQAIAAQSNAEWIAAVIAYISGTNTGLVDQYTAKWWPNAVFRGYFFPTPSPAAPLNAAQATATVKTFLNSNVGATYSQAGANVILLSDVSFVFTFPYTFTKNGVLVNGYVSQVFSRLPDGQFAVTSYTELDFAPTGSLSLPAAQYLAEQTVAAFVAAANGFLSGKNPALLDQFYLSSVSTGYNNYISPTGQWLNATADLANLKMVFNASAGGFYWQNKITTVLLNEYTFFAQFISYLAGPGNSSTTPMFNTLTFAKQGDGIYRIVSSTQLRFAPIQPITYNDAYALAFQTNVNYQLAVQSAFVGDLGPLSSYYGVLPSNYRAYYFPSAVLPATGLDASQDYSENANFFTNFVNPTLYFGKATLALIGPHEFTVAQPYVIYSGSDVAYAGHVTTVFAFPFVTHTGSYQLVSYTEFDTTPYTPNTPPPTTLPPITTTTTGAPTTTAAATTTTAGPTTTFTTVNTNLTLDFNFGIADQVVLPGTTVTLNVLSFHNLIQVDYDGYTSCDTANGDNVVAVIKPVGTAGTYTISADEIINGPVYFICTAGGTGTYTPNGNASLAVAATGGHCATGLKVRIAIPGATDVAPTTTAAPTGTTTTTILSVDFNYGVANQTVTAGTAINFSVLSFFNFIQVNAAGYANCDLANGANVVQVFAPVGTGGNFLISASAIMNGPLYFISTGGGSGSFTPNGNASLTVPNTGGHCATGLKVVVTAIGATPAATTTVATTTTTTAILPITFNFGLGDQTVAPGTTVQVSVLSFHNLIQVNYAGFTSCDLGANGANVIQVLAAVGSNGTYTIPATTINQGPVYLICTAGGTGSYTPNGNTSLTVPSFGGHCSTGLKIRIAYPGATDVPPTTTPAVTTTTTTTTTTTSILPLTFNFGLTDQAVAPGTTVQLTVLSFHNLIRVNQAGYTNCDLGNGTNVIQVFAAVGSAGTYTIPASTISQGPVYLICTAGGSGSYTANNTLTVPNAGGHCLTGLKVRIALTGTP